MSLDTENRTGVDEPVDGLDGSVHFSPAQLWKTVYAFFYNKRFGLILILLTGLLALFGVLFPQAPAGVRADPESFQAWLATVRGTYGGWTDIMAGAGLFNMFSSIPFAVVMVLLALSIIACTVHRLPQLWKRATRPRVHVTEKFFDRAQYRASMVLPLAPQAALDHVGGVLGRSLYRRLPDDRLDGGAVGMYADRFRWGPFGTAIAHAAMVVILAAFGVSAFTGFEENLDISVGHTVEVGHGTGLSVTAVSFKDSYDENGRPSDYVSHLVVERDGQIVGEQDVRVNEPLRVDGTALHQASFGVAAALRITDPAGAVLFEGPVPLKWQSNDGRYAIGKITPEGTGTEVLVVTPASGATDANIAPGSAVFELYDVETDEKVDVLPVEQGEEAEGAGMRLTFERELRYTGIIARQDPGAAWMWVGSTLLVLGMCMTFMARHRRLWVRVTPDGDGSLVQIASAEKLDTTFERHFRTLIERIDATAPETDESRDEPDPSETTQDKELIDA